MSLNDVEKLQKNFPKEIKILAKKRNEAAVFMTQKGSHILHDQVLVHGPGYILKSSSKNAISALNKSQVKQKKQLIPFTITEDQVVLEALDLINTQNIEDQIIELENYGTRHHATASGTQSAIDLKAKWEAMITAYSRTDISVRLVNHINTKMPSVVMTIQGAEFPDEYVIVGGHLDSTSNQALNNAPGADDDASGIATITESARALIELGFIPKRTIEIMAYAAEEIGLVGSSEIAKDYKNNNINVIAVGQFDMTNYNGSAKDIYFIEDNTDETLNDFFKELLEHYNASGEHQLSYGSTLCNYGCSDHASWYNEGYRASFPFEASFSGNNPNIHTTQDTFSISKTAEHATKFTKLCIEFLIETAKSNSEILLSVNEFSENGYNVFVQNNFLHYKNTEQLNSRIKSLYIHDANGKKILQEHTPAASGKISLNTLSSGVYIVSIQLENEKRLSKKIILE